MDDTKFILRLKLLEYLEQGYSDDDAFQLLSKFALKKFNLTITSYNDINEETV